MSLEKIIGIEIKQHSNDKYIFTECHLHKTRMYFSVNVVHFIHWSLSDVDENYFVEYFSDICYKNNTNRVFYLKLTKYIVFCIKMKN